MNCQLISIMIAKTGLFFTESDNTADCPSGRWYGGGMRVTSGTFIPSSASLPSLVAVTTVTHFCF